MSTTPPEPRTYGYSSGTTLDIARLPIPGNAEFAVFAIAQIVFLIALYVSEQVKGQDWLMAATITTAAYLISRGLAKASRVLEQ